MREADRSDAVCLTYRTHPAGVSVRANISKIVKG